MPNLTLPSITRAIDDKFMTVWYDIQKETEDIVLNSNIVSAALREKGCFVTQNGGKYITRGVSYALPTTKEVVKGDVFSQGEIETETQAEWQFKFVSGHVQRNIFDDRECRSEHQIRDYVKIRLQKAKDALELAHENAFKKVFSATAETTDKSFQGLNELIPPYANRLTGTWGKMLRSDTLWIPQYKAMSANPETNLISDMNNLYNTLKSKGKGQISPDFIICDQETWEIYQDFALDASQIIKEDTTHLADLGYDVLRYNGKTMVMDDDVKVSSKMQLLMLSTKKIEVVYDPAMWFEATEWKPIPLQGDRIMHILCAWNMVCSNPAKNGRLYES